MVRKKAKFRHIKIANKKYYFYSIKFADPTGDSGWHTSDELKKFEPSIMVSQAYIFSKDKKFIKTFSSPDTIKIKEKKEKDKFELFFKDNSKEILKVIQNVNGREFIWESL